SQPSTTWYGSRGVPSSGWGSHSVAVSRPRSGSSVCRQLMTCVNPSLAKLARSVISPPTARRSVIHEKSLGMVLGKADSCSNIEHRGGGPRADALHVVGGGVLLAEPAGDLSAA